MGMTFDLFVHEQNESQDTNHVGDRAKEMILVILSN